MAFYGNVNILIHVHSFRNVDLCHQGLYRLRFNVYQELSSEVYNAAVPICLQLNPLDLLTFESDTDERLSFKIDDSSRNSILNAGAWGDPHCMSPAKIDPADLTFTSRLFRIRYCDEEVCVNDAAQFHLMADLTDPSVFNSPIFVEAELLYAENVNPTDDTASTAESDSKDPTTNRQPRLGLARDKNKNKNDEQGRTRRRSLSRRRRSLAVSSEGKSSSEFAVAAYQIFKINDPFGTTVEYVPLTFDACHVCLAQTSFVSSLTSIRQYSTIQHVVTPKLLPRNRKPKPPPVLTYNNAQPRTAGDSPVADNLSRSFLVESSARKQSDILILSLRGLRAGPFKTEFKEKETNREKMFRWESEMFTPVKLESEVAPTEPPRSIFAKSVAFDHPVGMNTARRLSRRSIGSRSAAEGLGMDGLASPRNLLNLTSELSQDQIIEFSEIVYEEYMTNMLTALVRVWVAARALLDRCLTSLELSALSVITTFEELKLPSGYVELVPAEVRGFPVKINQGTNVQWRISFPSVMHNDYCLGENVQSISESAAEQVLITMPKLKERMAGKQDQSVSSYMNLIADDTKFLSNQIKEVWSKLCDAMPLISKEVNFFLHYIWEQLMIRTYQQGVFVDVVPDPVIQDNQAKQARAKLADVIRQTNSAESVLCHVEDIHDSMGWDTFAVVFAEQIELGLETSALRFWKQHILLTPVQGSRIGRRRAQSVSANVSSPIARQVLQWKDEVDALSDSESTASSSAKSRMHWSDPLAELRAMNDMEGVNVIASIDETRLWDKIPKLSDHEMKLLRDCCPAIIEAPSAPKLYSGPHLIVFVHGFQGNASDMRILRNTVASFFPNNMFLNSSANENQTEGDIAAMGLRLAQEIMGHIQSMCPVHGIGRLSFVCHSLGGLIARAAIPHLSKLSSSFHTFFTLSSPHLGYIFARNRIVDAGIWVLKKWKKSVSLQQLSLSETKDPRDSFLYSLSKTGGLKSFSNVCLASSEQDQYIPLESARIEITDRIRSDQQWGALHEELVANVLHNVPKERIYRFDVNFKISQKNIDTFIGRTAHILFLESAHLMRTFCLCYAHFFA